MDEFFNKQSESIRVKLQTIDLDGCDISIDESVELIQFLEKCLSDLREYFLSLAKVEIKDEILLFKEYKPEILGLLLYFNKVHNIELKRPTGSNNTQMDYYDNELKSITFFFERNLDFYQYYRSNSTYLDECYFVIKKRDHHLCLDSVQFILDPLFSTGYDYKVAKIISNEMLRIYLNKKKHELEKQILINKDRGLYSDNNLQWTGSKAAAVELGYAIHCIGTLNNGNIDVKAIMNFIEAHFNIDLGDYYRTYISIRSRKKDRTPFLNKLIETFLRKMDKDDLGIDRK